VPGELVDIGRRPMLVASFAPPGAAERFVEWRGRNAAALAGIPPEAYRVEYGRAGDGRAGEGLFVRVRIEEGALPPGLEGPDEIGPSAGLPPRAA
jgi:hypothetical protein